MGEIGPGSALPPLPISAPQGRPSIRAMLHGTRTTDVLTRAQEWIQLEALGVRGPATVAQLAQPGVHPCLIDWANAADSATGPLLYHPERASRKRVRSTQEETQPTRVLRSAGMPSPEEEDGTETPLSGAVQDEPLDPVLARQT
eukprot:903689-Rhodomonas_salina.2